MRELGGQVLEIESDDTEALRAQLGGEFDRAIEVVDGTLRIEGEDVHDIVPVVMQRHGDQIRRLSLSHPSLQDVFLRKTGKRFVVTEPEPDSKSKRRRRR